MIEITLPGKESIILFFGARLKFGLFFAFQRAAALWCPPANASRMGGPGQGRGEHGPQAPPPPGPANGRRSEATGSGHRDGMVLKWEQAQSPDWDEPGGFAPAARYNSTTG